MSLATQDLERLAGGLTDRGRAERGRYMWHDGDAYVRFLAEFFLRRSNRTTVQRFLPGFVEAVPTFEALAAAEPQEVVRLAWWAGLRRRVARLPEIAATFLSRDTWTAEELSRLPYIGAYAAHGIALYVFDEPTFPIDNNVRRVVGRCLGIHDEPGLARAVELLKGLAMEQGGVARLKDVHRGALALGWAACTVRPKCGGCPLNERCAFATAQAEQATAA